MCCLFVAMSMSLSMRSIFFSKFLHRNIRFVLLCFRNQRFPSRNGEELHQERLRADADGPQKIFTGDHKRQRARQSTREHARLIRSLLLKNGFVSSVSHILYHPGGAPGGEHHGAGLGGGHRESRHRQHPETAETPLSLCPALPPARPRRCFFSSAPEWRQRRPRWMNVFNS